MDKSTVITVLIVVGLGGLALWLFLDSSTPVAGQSVPDSCGGGVMGSIGKFIKGHVDRKNSVAPTVIGQYTGGAISGSNAQSVAKIADKLSPSGYAESFLGDKVGSWFCKVSLPDWGDIKAAAGTVYGTAVEPGVTFGKSQLASGTVGPVKSLYSAGDNLVHGNFGAAGKDVVKSVIDGPKAAASATWDAVKSINPF